MLYFSGQIIMPNIDIRLIVLKLENLFCLRQLSFESAVALNANSILIQSDSKRDEQFGL